MGKGGMKSKEVVDVQKEQFGIEIDAEQFKLVGMVKNGMKIFGNASAHSEQYLMELTVFQTLAKMAEYGIT